MKAEVRRQRSEGRRSGPTRKIADCWPGLLRVSALSLVLGCVALASAQYYRAPTGEFPKTDQLMNVWVYFTDKGFTTEAAADRILTRLTPGLDSRATERRLLELGRSCDFDDIPPSERYIEQIQGLGAELRVRSAWLNAASFRMAPELMAQAAKLPFVHRVTQVAARWEPTGEHYYPLKARYGGVQGGQDDTTRFKSLYRLAYDQNNMLGVPQVYAMGITGSGVRLGLLDTGLKRKHSAVKGLKIAGEHDFLSGDRVFVAQAGNAWTPETIPNLTGIGILQDPVVCQANGIWYLVFVADTVQYGSPLRGLFYSTSTDNGANWTRPTMVYYDGVFQAVHRPSLVGRDSFAYVAWESALRSEASPQVFAGYFRRGFWQGATQVLPGTVSPSLCLKNDRVYVVALSKDSALWFNSADVSAGTPFWGTGHAVVHFPELVKEPGIVKNDAGELFAVACGWRTGEIYVLESQDEGATFQELSSPALTGAEQPLLTTFQDTLQILYKDNTSSPFVGLRLARSADGSNWVGNTVVDSLLGIGEFDLQSGTLTSVAYENEGRVRVATSPDRVTWSIADSLGSAEFSCCPRWLGDNQVLWVERGDNNTDVEPGDSLRFGENQADHGTRMASIIAGFQEHSMVGVAPGVEFLISKNEFHSFRSSTIGYEFSLEEDTYIEGLEWAERHGADIISSSLGYTGWYTSRDYDGKTAPISIAAGRAVERGVLVVTAMGNRDTTVPANDWPNPYIVTPGDAFNVITAGGVEKDSAPWHTLGGGGTGCGPTADGRVKPDLVAMSDSVTVVAPDSTSALEGSSGTSSATALLAGCCALVKEAHPDWSAVAVRDTMFRFASKSTPDDTFGWGIPNVAKILTKYPPAQKGFTGDELGDPFPNPLAGSPKQYFPIHLLRPATMATLSIFSLSGEMVLTKKLDPGRKYLTAPGRYDDRAELDQIGSWWEGRNSQGNAVGSGGYYAVLQTTFGRSVRRFAVVR